MSILLQDGLGILPSHVSIVEGGFSWTLGAAIAEGVRLAGLGSGVAAKLGVSGGMASWGVSAYQLPVRDGGHLLSDVQNRCQPPLGSCLLR